MESSDFTAVTFPRVYTLLECMNYNITEEDLQNLIKNLLPKSETIVMMTGKQGVRDFARAWYGDNYKFSQLLSLFRFGVISGYRLYTIKS